MPQMSGMHLITRWTVNSALLLLSAGLLQPACSMASDLPLLTMVRSSNSLDLHLDGMPGESYVVEQRGDPGLAWVASSTNTIPNGTNRLGLSVDSAGPARLWRAWQQLDGHWEWWDHFAGANTPPGDALQMAPTGQHYMRSGSGRQTWAISNHVLSVWGETLLPEEPCAPRLGLLLSNTPTSLNFLVSLRPGRFPDTIVPAPGFCITVSTNWLIPWDGADPDIRAMIHLNHYITLAQGGVNLATNYLTGTKDYTWVLGASNSPSGEAWLAPAVGERFLIRLARIGTNALRYTCAGYSVEIHDPLVGQLWGRSAYFQFYPSWGVAECTHYINIHAAWAGDRPAERERWDTQAPPGR
jgi:hypothetical protein